MNTAFAALLLESDSWAEQLGFQDVEAEIKGRRFWRTNRVNVIACAGKFAPEIAILVEHLSRRFGVRKLVRVATCGSLIPRRIGDVLLFDGAVRGEGTSRGYAPPSYPAAGATLLGESLRKALGSVGQNYESTYVWTTDWRFLETRGNIAQFSGMGVTAVDMETSALYIVARAKMVDAYSIGLVTDVVRPDASEEEAYYFDESSTALMSSTQTCVEVALTVLGQHANKLETSTKTSNDN